MTDNGSCYRSETFRAVCRRLGIRQIFTKPYTPRTNGKAERFIQTALREWPTLAPIRIRINDQPNCPTGSIATIGIGHMVA
jgi:transposase InsO family protein